MLPHYIEANRAQLYLLPPSMEDWLPAQHLVWFVLDVLSVVETAAFHERYTNGGWEGGRPAYHPEMMLGLLIYAYCTGVRSSRKIERLCSSDVAYRVISADSIPDHATIARFRAEHQEAIKGVFVDVLRICAKAGLASLGTVAIDGTKMEAAASLDANRQADAIEAEVARILAEAEMTDNNEQDLFGAGSDQQLPPELARRSSRLAHLRAAQAELRARQARAEEAAAEEAAKARAAAAEGRKLDGRKPTRNPQVELARARADVEVARRRAARRLQAAAEGRKLPGPKPRPDAARSRSQELPKAQARLHAAEAAVAEAARKERVNVTDPASRVMKTERCFIQGYNAQAAVNEHLIVIASGVTSETNDVRQLVPMMAQIQRMATAAGIEGRLNLVLADAGYWSDDNATAQGPDRLIATTNDRKRRQALREQGPCSGPPPVGVSPREAMEHRLRTAEGANSYKKRSQTVEPVFGSTKANHGYRRFLRRGLAAVESEWSLICTIHNLLKLFQHQSSAGSADPVPATA